MHSILENTADFLVKKRSLVLCAMLILTLLCAAMISKVHVNTDMTVYLPADSAMKQGIDQMKADFTNLSMGGTVRVMTTDMPAEKLEDLIGILRQIPEVTLLTYQADSPDYNKEGHALIELTVLFDTGTPEMDSLLGQLDALKADYPLVYQAGEEMMQSLPTLVLVGAIVLLFTILFLMCRSWAEPFLFLIAIGCAVGINSGTNALLPSVSNVTNSICAVLQLVLSMDYSIILTNRYREDRKTAPNKEAAMRKAIIAAMPSVAGSSLTTFVGLLALVFMKFTIGADIGIVLAKGVLCSLICILTILPGLILYCDGLITRTEKKVIPLPTGLLSRFSWKSSRVLGVVLILLFGVTFFLKDGAAISYTYFTPNPIDDVFGKSNPIVVLYSNEDEGQMEELLAEFSSDSHIRSINCYASTFGKAMTSDELLTYLDTMGYGDQLASYASFLPMLFGSSEEDEEPPRLTFEEMLTKAESLLNNPLIGRLVPAEAKEQLSAAGGMLAEAKGKLVGATHSLLVFTTSYELESAETNAFLQRLTDYTSRQFSRRCYLIGNSPMQFETSRTFQAELNKISLITAIAIFLVVLVTFRNLCIPVLLVLLIQTAVYLTMLFMGWIGSAIYYLALLIVQSILMGATIDYAILYVSLYQESRQSLAIPEAIADSYRKAIHTIMTSGMIIVVITWIIGYAFEDPSVTQICHIITVGSLMALTLILCILPGAVAAFDRWVCQEVQKQ